MKLNGLNVVTKFPRVNSKYQFNINPSERVRIDVNENSFKCLHETKSGDEWLLSGATGARGPIDFVEKQFSKAMKAVSSMMKEAENIK